MASQNRPKTVDASLRRYLETTEAEFEREYAINVKPCVFLTQAVAGALINRGLPGSIVHVSSVRTLIWETTEICHLKHVNFLLILC